MRTSKPYTETVDGVTPYWPGQLVERDDGWWRCIHVYVYWKGFGLPDAYRSDVTWVPA